MISTYKIPAFATADRVNTMLSIIFVEGIGDLYTEHKSMRERV